MSPDALRQVLLNLALNAIEASEARRHACGCSRRACESGVAIAVEDEGPGVPEALRARLFEPFFSTKSRAGGLGLAITRRLVEEAGGVDRDRGPRAARLALPRDAAARASS